MDDIQRIIELLKDEIKCACYRDESLCGICKTYLHIDRDESIVACKYAISAMQELQQYRQIGASPERCKELICERSAAKRILGHYEAIGTPEECRKAVEKQKPKKPIKAEESRIRYTEGYICPRCGGGFSGTGIAGYCYHCGQAIDWSEEENDGEINNS